MEDIFKRPSGTERGGEFLIFELKNKLVGINSRIDIATKYKGTRRNGNRNYSKLSTERKKKNIKSFSDLYHITQSNIYVIWGLEEKIKEKILTELMPKIEFHIW